MTNIIPRDKIRHLEWKPGDEVVKEIKESPNIVKPTNKIFNLDAILKGQPVYNDDLAEALKEALTYESVLTMPELITAKCNVDEKHQFWEQWYSVHTEENIGIDKKGRFYTANEPVLVVVNGGGILTPKRIKQAYEDGLIDGSAKYTDSEFNNLLEGDLPDGRSIKLYKFEEIEKGIKLPHEFGVVIPYNNIKDTIDGYMNKSDFIKNPLVIVRNGGLNNLDAYFDKAKDSDDEVGNHHVYNGRDVSTPQGRVLFLLNFDIGLSGSDDIYDNGRFFGVGERSS